jgi:flagellar protein FliJ
MANPFSLAALLRLRRLQQDRAAAEVSTSRARAAQVAARRRYAQNSLANLMAPNGSTETLRWTAAARAASSSTLGDLGVLEDEWERRMAEARAHLEESRAKTIALEKLEERHDEAEQKELLRTEQIALDEIAARSLNSPNSPTKWVTS